MPRKNITHLARRKKSARTKLQTGPAFTQTAEEGFEAWGILAGDVLTLEYTDDARFGELVGYELRDDKGNGYLSRVISLTDDALTVLEIHGETNRHDRSQLVYLARPVSYTRTVRLRPDPATDATPEDSPARVIDLAAFRQSRPQRAPKPLFAERA
jgi:hypothetical protein